MANFTDIPAGFPLDCHLASFVNEVRLGIRERYYAGYGSWPTTTISADGTDMQHRSWWRAMQEDIDGGDLWSTYVNHAIAIEGETAETMYTRSSWITAAGLGGAKTSVYDCFRRATTRPTNWTNFSDAAYSYGIAQDGDIIGPWLMVDIQLALKALKWTKKSLSATSDGQQKAGEGYSNVDCSTAQLAAITAFEDDWVSDEYANLYQAQRESIYDSGGDPKWWFYEFRQRAKPNFSVWVPTGLTYDYDAYIYISYANGSNPDPTSPGSGWDTEDILYKYESVAGKNSSTLEAGYPSSAETDLFASGMACPIPDGEWNTDVRMSGAGATAILKWNFTNT